MEPFFYADWDVPPYCPTLRHEADEPEPFFRGSGQPYFLDADGRIVDEDGKATWWFAESDRPAAKPMNPQPRFADPMDAAVALMLDEGAFFLGRAFISVDWREYI